MKIIQPAQINVQHWGIIAEFDLFLNIDRLKTVEMMHMLQKLNWNVEASRHHILG
jgi:hypothetical protein